MERARRSQSGGREPSTTGPQSARFLLHCQRLRSCDKNLTEVLTVRPCKNTCVHPAPDDNAGQSSWPRKEVTPLLQARSLDRRARPLGSRPRPLHCHDPLCRARSPSPAVLGTTGGREGWRARTSCRTPGRRPGASAETACSGCSGHSGSRRWCSHSPRAGPGCTSDTWERSADAGTEAAPSRPENPAAPPTTEAGLPGCMGALPATGPGPCLSDDR